MVLKEISLSTNGKITRTMSSVSLGGDKSCCWSKTFESMKLLMVAFTTVSPPKGTDDKVRVILPFKDQISPDIVP